MSNPQITAIVATRDRPDALARCLRALDAQRSELALDIVVVDDRSIDAARVERVVGAVPGARLLVTPRPGISAARNAGVLASETDVVAFTDDDGEVQPGWARALLARTRKGAALVGGATVSPDGAGALAVATQLASNALLTARPPVAPASNLACRRDVALELPFDEGFVEMGGEEREWCARLGARGYVLQFEPRAVVVHRQDLTLRRYLQKHIRYGRGAYRYRHDHAGGRLEPGRFYAALLVAGFRQGIAVGLALSLAQLATAAGFLVEARAAGA